MSDHGAAARFRDLAAGVLAWVLTLAILIGLGAAAFWAIDDRRNRDDREAACAELGARAGGARWELRGVRECYIENIDGVEMTMQLD